MEVFFLDQNRFQFYYNCNTYDVDSVPMEQRRKIGWGMFAITLCFALQCLYLPCLYAISRPKLLAQSCYKIMLFMGVANVCELFVVGIMGGVYDLLGMVFCQHPTLFYFNGVTAHTIYYTEMTTDCLLAFNRMLTMVKPTLAQMLFDGKRTLIWLCLVVVGPLCFATLSPPYIYNPIIDTWVHFPHHGYLEMRPEDESFYYQPWHQFYSCTICITLLIIYGTFLAQFFRDKHLLNNQKERSIFIQVFWISMLCAFVCVSYSFDKEMVSRFPFLVPVYTYMYLVYQGSPALVYLLLNETIRKQIVGIMTKSRASTFVRAVSIFPSGV